VTGVTCRECPVSLITSESLIVLESIARAKRAHEFLGAAIMTGDLPARLVDAIDIASQEQLRVREAFERSAEESQPPDE